MGHVVLGHDFGDHREGEEQRGDAEDDEEPEPDKSVASYLDKLQVLMFAYAIAGSNKLQSAPGVETRTCDSTQFVQVPLDILMRYYWRAAYKVQFLPASRQLQWLQSKDEAERSRWVDVHRNSSKELGAIISEVYLQREGIWEPPLIWEKFLPVRGFVS